jgi:pimeloyl-ACP methyl ester carboxylesterase
VARQQRSKSVREENVTIASAGLRLAGAIRIPAGLRPGEQRAAFLVLHGFGSNKNSQNVLAPCKVLDELGYVTLRFDMRGCGESEGDHGSVICLEQVEDLRNALTFLSGHPAVAPDRIAVIGTSFGGAVAVYAGGIDERIAAVISNGGWGNGERKFRGQHATPEAWARFTGMLAEGRAYRERTGRSLMVPRYDIVPIPARLSDDLAGRAVQMFPAGTIAMFPAETAQSMFDFRADDVVGRIAPRPLLLLHSANDSVTPTEQSVEMFKRAGQPSELHLFSGVDHFMFAEDNARVWRVIRDWLETYFPATVAAHVEADAVKSAG